MIIKILSPQIPVFWDAIKYTVKAVTVIPEQDLQSLYVELLQALLNDKAQCFAFLDDKRTLKGMIITRIAIDKIRDYPYIHIEAAFGWDKLTDEDYKECYNLIVAFSKRNDCRYMIVHTINPRILEIASRFGFKKKFEVLEAKI